MNAGDYNLSGPFSRWKESWLVWLLCAVAGLRVFVYAAAFPFFNNVDEQAHFDLVMKYSRLRLPAAMENYSPESAAWIALFGSPEYLMTPDKFPDGKFPPPHWLHPSEPVPPHFGGSEPIWANLPNHESTGGPLYYVLAGLWMDLGRGCGFDNIYLLYWIRFSQHPPGRRAGMAGLRRRARDFSRTALSAAGCAASARVFPAGNLLLDSERHAVAALLWGGLSRFGAVAANGGAQSAPGRADRAGPGGGLAG